MVDRAGLERNLAISCAFSFHQVEAAELSDQQKKNLAAVASSHCWHWPEATVVSRFNVSSVGDDSLRPTHPQPHGLDAAQEEEAPDAITMRSNTRSEC